MKNKKVIIGIIIAVVIVGLAVYFYIRNKKKLAAAGTTAAIAGPNVASKPVGDLLSTGVVKQTQVPVATVQSPTATNPNPAVGELPFTNVIRGGSGEAQLQYTPVTKEINAGDKIQINSGAYAGTHKVTYVYRGKTSAGLPGYNIYIDKPFTVAEKGTFTKL